MNPMNSKSQIQKLKTSNNPLNRLAAFSLIELLVVIAVIAILAGLLFTAMPAVNRARMMGVARSELTQITTAIEAYKRKYGTYPQDSPVSVAPRNPLYYELAGMQQVQTPASYKSLDGTYSIAYAVLTNSLKVEGILNSSTTLGATDEREAVESFLKELKPAQIATNGGVRVLACTVDDDLVWRYNSTNPTNNAGTYDLWVDVVVGRQTNRVGNWNN
jgi:prepilin-type N-terminal cleavage/methylation domain-containing protein